MKTLDPGASEIWKVYSILAKIADAEGQHTQAREYRRLARQNKRDFAGTRHELGRHASLILGAVAAINEPGEQDMLEQILSSREQRGWKNLASAIRRILSGERDIDALCEELDHEDSMIVEAILDGLKEPSSLQDLLPPPESPS